MTIYFIRHCGVKNPQKLVYGRLPGFPLSEKGEREAHNLADFLKNSKITKIYASPLERTRETAEILAAQLNAPVQTSDLLLEIDFSSWEGKTLEQFHAESGYPGQVKDGETYQQVTQRVLKIINQIKKGKDRIIAIVSHRDVLTVAILILCQKPIFPHIQSFFLPKGAVYKLELDDPIVTGDLVWYPKEENGD